MEQRQRKELQDGAGRAGGPEAENEVKQVDTSQERLGAVLGGLAFMSKVWSRVPSEERLEMLGAP